MTVFVLNLHHRGPDKRAIPPWLRRLFLGTLRSRGSTLTHRDAHGLGYGGEGAHLMRNLSLKVTLENLAHELREELHLENGGLLEGHNTSDGLGVGLGMAQSPPRSPPSSSPPAPSPYGFVVPLSTTSSTTTTTVTTNINTNTNTTTTATGSNPGSNVSRRVDFSRLQPSSPPPQQPQQQHHQQQHPPQPTPSPTPPNLSTPEGLASHILQQGLGVGGGGGSGGGGGGGGGKSLPNTHPQRGSSRRRQATGYNYEEVLLSLLRVLERHDRDEKEYESVQDWRRLAQTVDRILFFFFLVLTVVCTVAVLVIAPALQE